jgi:hypothetical protein
VDTDDLQPVGANILELVGSLWAGDHYITGAGFDILTIHGEPPFSGADDPGFGIGMLVQVRPVAGHIVDKETRDPRTVGFALEGDRAPGAGLQFA